MAARGHTIMRREPACVGGTVVRGPAQQARWRLALLSWSSPSLPSRCRRAPCLSPLCPPPPPHQPRRRRRPVHRRPQPHAAPNDDITCY